MLLIAYMVKLKNIKTVKDVKSILKSIIITLPPASPSFNGSQTPKIRNQTV